ncbi:hypothetical protein TrVGV298_003683 [Trichoderma virens]|nr:hypothetical protein TrVGV298_003683 [Trichoderma virens]
MKAATDMWEGVGASFKQVGRYDQATFAVIYNDDYDDTDDDDDDGRKPYARSFFPTKSSSRKLIVYPLSLRKRDCLANILAHELGHILGLRHEAAQEKEQSYFSVRFGKRNPRSIMNYFKDPKQLRVTKQDLKDLDGIYTYDQPAYGGLRIVDIDPQVRPFKKTVR